MTATVTPCTSTVTATETTTVTTAINTFPLKRNALPEPSPVVIEARQDGGCTFTTNTPTAIPTWAPTACPALGTTMPAARYSSACSCNGVTAVTTTLATPTVTVTATETATATVYPTPSAFILQSTGDQSLYVTVDNTGAIRLTHDATTAVPFYKDSSNQLRNLHDPSKLLVDYYIPNAGTADNTVYVDAPSDSNYRITCSYNGDNADHYYGDCQASGPPNGNPVVYGFGTCPNEGYYLYMIRNNDNVHCWDGGYAFLGFYLLAYTGN